MSKSRYFRIRLFIDCGTINPKCVYDNIHVYTRLYSAKRAARSMALANYPPASYFVNEVATSIAQPIAQPKRSALKDKAGV